MAFVVHFSPFDGRRVFSPNPKKKTWLWKTLWEKEKLLVTSNFSLSRNVFYTMWHLIFSSPKHNMLKGSFKGGDVVRRASSTISLNIFWWTAGPNWTKIGRNVP